MKRVRYKSLTKVSIFDPTKSRWVKRPLSYTLNIKSPGMYDIFLYMEPGGDDPGFSVVKSKAIKWKSDTERPVNLRYANKRFIKDSDKRFLFVGSVFVE